MVKVRLICIFALLLLPLIIYSQSLTRSVICITGNSSLENEGRVSYSIGEAVVQTNLSNDPPFYTLTQGFQQPALINTYSTERLGINAVEVFPNPVQSDLTILFNTQTDKELNIVFFTSSGVLLYRDAIQISDSGSILINMEQFAFGFYLLHVYSDDKLLDRIFKIEKM